MGFEGHRKPPQFVIKAAMAEDPSILHAIASKGGKAAAEKRKAEKARREEEEQRAREALEAEREILDEVEQEILRSDALAHDRAFTPPNEDFDEM